MKVSYDVTKRVQTLEERGLDMAKAGDVFLRAYLTVEDDKRDYGETRFITFGTFDERMVVLVWTWRGETCRIISMRKANEREQKIYGPRLD